MPVSARSFAKINLGLAIGPARADGFHELRTIYQTVALHDVIKVDVAGGKGIEIRCKDSRVPDDETNTCYRVAERALRSLKLHQKLTITIEKHLPVQGGLGAGSSNGVATLLALEKALKTEIDPGERLLIAAEVGSDLPLFLVGGTILGIGRGEQVYPLEDLPAWDVVIVTQPTAVSTPQAFADWDKQFGSGAKLTDERRSDTMRRFSHRAFEWLGSSASGVAVRDGDRAEALLLDLVRAGIENDFERVVFPQYPELRDLKRALERAGARYASLSGSGSTLYGLFDAEDKAQQAAATIAKSGVPAVATRTLPRADYWKQMFAK